MKRILSPSLPRPGVRVALSENEARHATSVLRLREGERVLALDGSGKAVEAFLRNTGKAVELEFAGEARLGDSGSVAPVTLELAILKGDSMSWAIEKCVELGVERLIPVMSAHTVVQIDKKGPEEFQRRWQRIADQALKQCGRLQALEVALPQAFPELLAQPLQAGEVRLWCDDQGRAEAPSLWRWLTENGVWARLRILIGPEGGFSASERELLQRTSSAVSLGPLTLRAETAALTTASLITSAYRSRSEA